MSFKCFTIPDARIEIKKSQCSGVFVSYSELLDTLWKSAWKFVSLNFTSKYGFCADDGAGASADWNVHFHTESLIVFPLFFFFLLQILRDIRQGLLQLSRDGRTGEFYSIKTKNN